MKLSYQIQAMHPMHMPTTFLVQRGGVRKGNTERRPASLFFIFFWQAFALCMDVRA